MNIIITKFILILFLLSYSLFLLSLYNAELILKWKAALIFFIGALMFIFVFIVQNPIQVTIANSSLLSEQKYIVGVALIAIIAGFLQEFLKMVPALSDRWNVFAAAASGAGFGFIEAMIMLVPYSSYTILGILEWLVVIAFQISSTAFIFYGFSINTKKGIQFYVLISLLHALLETAIILHKMKPMLFPYSLAFLFLITLPLFIFSVKKYKNALL
jgi:hypothetical protein